MHCLRRIGLAMTVLALSVPAATRADSNVPSGAASPSTAKPASGHKHRRNVFGREILCTECQRQKLATQGVVIPPPPPTGPNGVYVKGSCPSCEAEAAAMGGVVTSYGMQGGEAPGHAVAGGGMPAGMPMDGSQAPGYASTGDGPTAEPTPIGVVQPRRGAQAAGRMAMRSSDSAVRQSALPAPEPIPGGGSGRPHVLSHLFGFAAIGRDARDAREKKSRESHASIRYDEAPQKVNELPASMVYGPGGR